MFGASLSANIAYGFKSDGGQSLASSAEREAAPGEPWPETRLQVAASEEEIEGAARQAHAHDFVMALPGGYNTRISDK